MSELNILEHTSSFSRLFQCHQDPEETAEELQDPVEHVRGCRCLWDGCPKESRPGMVYRQL